jgi:hypothetical protein
MQVEVNFPSLLQQLNIGGAKPLIQAIEEARGSRVMTLVYNDLPPLPTMLLPPVVHQFEKLLRHTGRVEKLDLFLRSTGGVTEVPWRIISLAREFAETLGVIVCRIALSGATHIAIAADELVMTPYAALGSVDPTRNHPLLPKDKEGNPIPTSVEDLKHCIRFIKEQLGESYYNQNLAQIISELFKYIDPLAIGALEQSYNLSKLITRKCLGSRNEKLPDEQVEKIVKQLAGEYFSHSFLISRKEVEEDLGLDVVRPDDKLTQLIGDLENHYVSQFSRNIQVSPPKPEPLMRVGGVLQTADVGSIWAQVYLLNKQLIADPWMDFR